VTPGRRDPRPSGLGPVGWLWWPVVMAGWSLAGAVMAAEALARAAPRPGNGSLGAGSDPRAPKPRGHKNSLYGAALAISMIQALAACQPLPGGSATTAAAPSPPTTVPNPFFCPRRATP
jgi:hypothetical protein